ncbi:MAG: hypothetical protein ACI9R3_004044 [Verrucomicrobiales bacterium]|jgi:hypothetical protein
MRLKPWGENGSGELLGVNTPREIRPQSQLNDRTDWIFATGGDWVSFGLNTSGELW